MAPRKLIFAGNSPPQEPPTDEEIVELVKTGPLQLSTELHRMGLSSDAFRSEAEFLRHLQQSPFYLRTKFQQRTLPYMPYLIRDRSAPPPLLELPQELRDQIINYSLEEVPATINITRTRSSVPLLRVNRQLYHETAEAVYKTRTIQVPLNYVDLAKNLNKKYVRKLLLLDSTTTDPGATMVMAGQEDERLGLARGAVYCPENAALLGVDVVRFLNVLGEEIFE